MGQFSDLSDEQLVHQALTAERDLVSKRFKHKMNQLENQAQLGGIRRNIARMQTEARTREISQGLTKGALFAKHQGSFSGASAGGSSAPAAEKGGFLSGIVDKLTAKE